MPGRNVILAHHLIFTAYGHWLPNDLRGSNSLEVRQPRFADLGEIHPGRRPEHEQPSAEQLRDFYRRAEPRLEHRTVWFDYAKRQAVGQAFAVVIRAERYTAWACAVLADHAHLLVRRHRDDGCTLWRKFAQAAAQTLRTSGEVPSDHPVWGNRPYSVFKDSPDSIRVCVDYINRNPAKHGLPDQHWPFIQRYDGWPHPTP